jgi:serine phosphatase RsbU (regulator of sigma subunit)
MAIRERQITSSDVAEITLMSPGDIVFLYSDGVYDGNDEDDRPGLERVVRDNRERTAKEICNAILEHALKQDEYFRQIAETDRIDDKTAFIIKYG